MFSKGDGNSQILYFEFDFISTIAKKLEDAQGKKFIIFENIGFYKGICTVI